VVFPPDSRLKIIDGFQECTSLTRVEIPASVQMTDMSAFEECAGLTEVTFAPGSCLKIIDGFVGCISLRRVEIPASVVAIFSSGFYRCRGLMEVVFQAGSRLKVMNGFRRCPSLCRLEIPPLVERLCSWTDDVGFQWIHEPDLSLPELVVQPGTRIRPVPRVLQTRAFVTFVDMKDLKMRRRELHLEGGRPTIEMLLRR
jgi:hypothetical protein